MSLDIGVTALQSKIEPDRRFTCFGIGIGEFANKMCGYRLFRQDSPILAQTDREDRRI